MPTSNRRSASAFALIGAIVVALLAAFGWATGWLGPRRISGGDVTAALEANAGGVKPGYRRAHAKGLCFTGAFAANGAGTSLTKAQFFRPGSIPIVGRFALAGGNPLAGDGRSVFHSMAILMRAPNGEEWRLAMDHKRVSPVDPAARYTQAHGNRADFCYATNYLIDVDNAVIVDVEASTAVRQAEVTAAKRMIERVADRHGLWPRKLIGDTGYGSAGMLAWLVHERGFEPHVPVFDKSARSDGAFERSDFTFDHEGDSYICPAGKRLRPRNRNFTSPRPEADQDGFIRYRAQQQDCSSCALKPQCTTHLAGSQGDPFHPRGRSRSRSGPVARR